MNWLTRTVLPKIRALGRRKDTPDNLWEKCPGCSQMVFKSELEANQQVCPRCNHHLRIRARARFASLFDEGRYTEIPTPEVISDPLKFRDSRRYTERMRAARIKTGAPDSVSLAHGPVQGHQVVVAVQDFAFMGGSMGLAAGEAIITAVKFALAERAPVIVFSAAGGARMQEGVLSLMQMPRTVIAAQRLREAGLPFIVVLTDPTTGGVTASFAMLGDVTLAEPGVLIGFAGPRVIEQTIRETLPQGFQRAEYLLEHGMIDMVVHRHEMKATLSRVVDLLTRTAGSAMVVAARSESDYSPRAEIPHGSAPVKPFAL